MPEEIRNIKVLKNVNELENYNEEKKDKKRMEIPSAKEWRALQTVKLMEDTKKDRNSGYKKKASEKRKKKGVK